MDIKGASVGKVGTHLKEHQLSVVCYKVLVNIMKSRNNIRKIIFTGAVLLGGWLISFSGGSSLYDKDTTIGLETASASTQYGILGQKAPELELNTWIDEDGKPMDPIKLRDYQGKVIYLYFFQDW